MTVQPNGTKAKDIAIHFLKATNQMNSRNMPRTVKIAKSLLEKYSSDSIILAIDYLIDKRFPIYSLGFLTLNIESILKEIEQKKKANEEREKMQDAFRQSEVMSADESSERNRSKVGRFGVQSRFGEKFNFDMFEGH